MLASRLSVGVWVEMGVGVGWEGATWVSWACAALIKASRLKWTAEQSIHTLTCLFTPAAE